jgi:hypothetical protein
MNYNLIHIKTKFIGKYLFTSFIFIYSFFNETMCQEKINASLGIGFPELINVGVLYQHNQTQCGISFGGFHTSSYLLGDIFSYSISSDFYYHFAGNSKFSKRRPWLFRTGLTYFRASPMDVHILLNCRLGRDFNISETVGLCLSTGFIIRLYYFNSSNGEPIHNDKFFIFPSVGLSLFYRFGTNNKN